MVLMPWWSFFTVTFMLNDCLAFPASGFRNTVNGGSLWNVSTNCYQWATSSFGMGSLDWKGAFFNFNSGNVNPLNSGYRADAFSVRCVQAFTKTLRLSCKLIGRECCKLIKEGFAAGWFVNSAVC